MLYSLFFARVRQQIAARAMATCVLCVAGDTDMQSP
jgi:hypothetical protein